jgi:hypothetical protein
MLLLSSATVREQQIDNAPRELYVARVLTVPADEAEVDGLALLAPALETIACPEGCSPATNRPNLNFYRRVVDDGTGVCCRSHGQRHRSKQI